ncbi:hypothetical protein H5410_006682 [Solanum commersonii]|uniref:FBD domain-containing protein n=1 Tax=Solanum commersonii TaxID=4109 RepID=A0A9J6AAG9_SOLCO|nr:hypothetical protein H5410_006682 [Solanum commersonii]
MHLIHHGHPCGDWYLFEGDICCFEIVAPYVEHLTISGVFNHTNIKLGDLSSLKHANLDLVCDEFNEMDKHIVKDLLYHPFFEVEEIDLLEDKYLSFEENIFKVSLQNLKNVKVMPFCSCRRRSDETKLDQLLKFLLEHAINLEKLVIVPEHKEYNNCSNNTSYLMKKTRKMSASIWADLVEEKENLTSPLMSKLSPQASEFVPTSKANPSIAVTIDNF